MELLESSGNARTASIHRIKTKKTVNDIARTEGMTRSGRCYAPINSGIKERESSTVNEGIKIAALKGKDKKPVNEPVI